MAETEDDELAYAYYAANNQGEPYDRKRFSREYTVRAYRYYQSPAIQQGVSLILKAIGFKPNGWVATGLSKAAIRFMAFRQWRLAEVA